jgi:predicted transglutaminase-like cysteine proteinase
MVSLSDKAWAELVAVNGEVNRSIRPEDLNESVATETWEIAPSAGNCHDYAVTKRHELIALGWPSHALLLAEVVTRQNQHHLVLVVHTKQGDFVLDNLNANIRNWTDTRYRWVRIQTPENPKYWSSVRTYSL